MTRVECGAHRPERTLDDEGLVRSHMRSRMPRSAGRVFIDVSLARVVCSRS